jgi:mRNA-degrading endonuclease YafQ of YafQ-DinJ toxin-antitoxin module
MGYSLAIPFPFEKNLKKLPPPALNAAKKTLSFLSKNPKHPSLKTHKVYHAVGNFGGDVFEAYVTMKCRLTWEYGPEQGMITLRNIDNHDQCLKRA